MMAVPEEASQWRAYSQDVMRMMHPPPPARPLSKMDPLRERRSSLLAHTMLAAASKGPDIEEELQRLRERAEIAEHAMKETASQLEEKQALIKQMQILLDKQTLLTIAQAKQITALQRECNLSTAAKMRLHGELQRVMQLLEHANSCRGVDKPIGPLIETVTSMEKAVQMLAQMLSSFATAQAEEPLSPPSSEPVQHTPPNAGGIDTTQAAEPLSTPSSEPMPHTPPDAQCSDAADALSSYSAELMQHTPPDADPFGTAQPVQPLRPFSLEPTPHTLSDGFATDQGARPLSSPSLEPMQHTPPDADSIATAHAAQPHSSFSVEPMPNTLSDADCIATAQAVEPLSSLSLEPMPHTLPDCIATAEAEVAAEEVHVEAATEAQQQKRQREQQLKGSLPSSEKADEVDSDDSWNARSGTDQCQPSAKHPTPQQEVFLTPSGSQASCVSYSQLLCSPTEASCGTPPAVSYSQLLCSPTEATCDTPPATSCSPQDRCLESESMRLIKDAQDSRHLSPASCSLQTSPSSLTEVGAQRTIAGRGKECVLGHEREQRQSVGSSPRVQQHKEHVAWVLGLEQDDDEDRQQQHGEHAAWVLGQEQEQEYGKDSKGWQQQHGERVAWVLSQEQEDCEDWQQLAGRCALQKSGAGLGHSSSSGELPDARTLAAQLRSSIAGIQASPPKLSVAEQDSSSGGQGLRGSVFSARDEDELPCMAEVTGEGSVSCVAAKKEDGIREVRLSTPPPSPQMLDGEPSFVLDADDIPFCRIISCTDSEDEDELGSTGDQGTRRRAGAQEASKKLETPPGSPRGGGRKLGQHVSEMISSLTQAPFRSQLHSRLEKDVCIRMKAARQECDTHSISAHPESCSTGV